MFCEYTHIYIYKRIRHIKHLNSVLNSAMSMTQVKLIMQNKSKQMNDFAKILTQLKLNA